MTESNLTKTNKRNNYAPTTIGKVLAVLECFSMHHPRLTAAEIGSQLGLTSSTLYRYLNAMENEGYIEREPGTSYYVIGLRVVEFAGIALGRLEVRRHGQIELDGLSERLKMNANLGVLYRGDTFHLCYSVQTEVDQLYTILGRRTPAHCTAMGKAMLAHIPRQEAHEIVDMYGFKTLSENSIATHEQLDSALDEVKRTGYAVDRGEGRSATWCVASPVREQGGKVVAAMSVSSSRERVELHIEQIAKDVSFFANRLSYRLGYYES
ncbi:IclR family transcriptional regulator [Paenibacillus piri]|uniref:IclR family transcriptional regulator n=1 Tax=Paenibacillus piri TaxID=2547395 RepID=A0A4R5KKD8_9BACL|nr:IclR family transcriptional regulator [Paenibacillus piri]TDF94830.1 IclR family transcriptional regulator [Paenibacillus piri]